jgi:prepilin-type processing-associated H-X9-DG protein/prepilin-type N-terminal cleavage/methylation domain-containing protein
MTKVFCDLIKMKNLREGDLSEEWLSGVQSSMIQCFTLVELLVSLAVIAILMSLLSPSLTKLQEQTLNIRCLRQMKSVGLAQMLYAEDSDGHWILSSHYGEDGSDGGWAGRLATPDAMAFSSSDSNVALGYIENEDQLFCPKTGVHMNDKGEKTPFGAYAAFGNRYQNIDNMYVTETSLLFLPLRLSQSPSKMAPIYDGVNTYASQKGYGKGYYRGIGNNISIRHDERTNLLFTDGHASSMDLFSLENGEALMQNMGLDFFKNKNAMDETYKFNRTAFREAYTEEMTPISWTVRDELLMWPGH